MRQASSRIAKYLVLGIVLAVLASVVSVAYDEAPMLAELVRSGLLPSVEERLPTEPLVITPIDSVGRYGGTAILYSSTPIYVDAPGLAMLGMDYLFGGLATYDPENVSAWGEPNIAAGYEIGDEGRSTTVFLREGLKWSDGYPFTADDFVYFYEHVLKNDELYPAKPAWATYGGELVTVTKIDTYTVKFEFAEPYYTFLGDLTASVGNQPGILWNWGSFQAAHYAQQFHPDFVGEEEANRLATEAGFNTWAEHYWAKTDALFGTPSSFGPPVLAAYVCVEKTAERWVYQRNPYYWKVDTAGNQLPYIDQIIVNVVTDVAAIEGKVVSGESTFALGAAENLPLYTDNAIEAGYKVYVWRDGSGSLYPIQMNLTHPDPGIREIFNDFRFRKAVSYAIDRDAINKAAYFGLATPRAHTVPEGDVLFEPEFATAYVEYNPEEANALLDEMGLDQRGSDGYRLRSDGEPLILTIETAAVTLPQELIQENLQAVGLDVRLKVETASLAIERIQANQVDIITTGSAQDLGTAFILLPQHFVPISWSTVTTWGVEWARYYVTGGAEGEQPPPEMQQLIDWWHGMKQTPSAEERTELGKNILRSHAENLWIVGTIGMVPLPLLVDEDMRNIPSKGLWSWSLLYMNPYTPQQFYFADAVPLLEASYVLYTNQYEGEE